MADGVKISFDFSEIMEAVTKLGVDIKTIEPKATLKAAKLVKQTIENKLERSEVKKESYTHMKDDVLITGLKDVDGERAREVKGGRKTGYKWRFLEFGTSNMQPNNFMSRSIEETQNDVKSVIENEIEKVIPK